MRQDYRLYVDENGVADLTHWDKNFTLCGIIVKRHQAEQIKISADQIKFKYWGRTDVVFHSHDIAKKEGDFSILNDPNVEANFNRDMSAFLHSPEFRCMIVSVDKEAAKIKGWNSNKILDQANGRLIEMFLKFLTRQKSPSRGQIILESSSAQDIAFYKQYAFYLAHGFPALGLTEDDTKKTLTSLSFVSKGNHDIEAQLADIFAYPATHKFLHLEGKKPIVPGTHIERLCNILWNKLADLGPATTTKACIRLPEA